MSTAVIIGGGDFPKKEYPLELIRRADVIVCCDGNALKSFIRNREKLFGTDGRRPDAVVGDMDSMPPKLAKEYSDILVQIAEQDDNDQTKAFHWTLENHPEVDTIHFLAATGKREDHTIGNLGLIMEYARPSTGSGTGLEQGRTIDMVSDYSTAFAVTDSCELVLGKGRRISLFSPDNSLRIKSTGLVWPTDDVVFDNWWKATLNRTSDDIVTLDFSHRSIALIILD